MSRVSELLASLKAALTLNRTRRAGKLPSPDAFGTAIRLEQARVDRNEHAFSLVVFETCDTDVGSPTTQLLVRSLGDRIRSTDEIGWFDRRRIGVLLPYTFREGAERFTQDICKSMGPDALPPKYTIYSYPSHRHCDKDGDNTGQLHFTDGSCSWDARGAGAPRSSGQQFECRTCPELVKETRSTQSPLPFWKRTMDIVGSLFGLAVTSPLLLVHTVALKCLSPGPVFFRQQRIGYMGRPFTMWKLRTMDVGVDASVHQEHVSQLISGANRRDSDRPMVKLDSHPHMIPGAIILRKTCLDELPQLINVLRGEMSLVGPRPPLPYEVEEFLSWQHRRFDAVPGMTGLWQVSGKNRLSFSKMIRLDIQYARRKSLLLDLKILLKTPLAIVSQIRDSLALQRKQRLMVEGKHV